MASKLKTAVTVAVLLLLVGQPAAHAQGNTQVRVGQNLADRVLAAIPFPLEVFIPSTGAAGALPEGILAEGDLGELVPLTVTATRRSGSAPVDDPEDEASAEFERLLVKALIEALRSPDEVTRLANSQRAPVTAILARVPANRQNEDGVREALRAASDAEFDALAKILKVWWEGDWTRIRINKRPLITLALPIAIPQMDASVRVRGRLCATFWIIGTACTPHFTIPWVNLKGDLQLALQAVDTRVVGLPRFAAIDVEIRVRILGKTIVFAIPVTKMVNGNLAKKPPIKLLDLASLQRDIPYSNQRLSIEAVVISAASPSIVLDVALVAKDK